MDNTAGSVKNQPAVRVLLKAGQNFIQRRNFFGKVLGFALGVGGTVRPAHPRGDTIDAPKTAGLQGAQGELRSDRQRKWRDIGKQMSGPIGFAGTGHADERKTEWLMGSLDIGKLKY